ncbi:MAG: asparagine synthase [Bacteroidota bacterium]
MCGIAGIVSLKPLPAREVAGICLQFSDDLAHRGPDDEGFVLIDTQWKVHAYGGNCTLPELNLPHIETAEGEFMAAFVHRRLSIIKPGPAGHQPFWGDKHVLCYNGETFNFRDLDGEFGFENQSRTDTETLFRLLQNRGSEAVQRLDGFFSMGFADLEKRTLHLRRDTTGVKPLVFTQTDTAFAFSSETRALRHFLNSVSINSQAVFHHLCEGVMLPDQGFYSEITSVQEGMDVDLQTLETEIVYYRENEENPDAELRSQLESSVGKRLMSDVPLGFAVSGGLDSAAVIGLARKLMGTDASISLFSIISSDPKSDERQWQQQVAEYNRAEWHCFAIEDAGPHLLEEVARATDLPPIAWNNLAHFELCRLAKSQGVTVFFNGQGADELFGGYPDYLYRDFWTLQGMFIGKNHLPVSYREAFKENLKLQAKIFLPFLSGMAAKRQAGGMLNADLWRNDLYLPRLSHLRADHKMQADFYGQKLRQMLAWEDLNGMAHGLESRNPFADDMQLAKWLNVPLKDKIKNGYTKGVLRDALQDVMTESVRWRMDKKGFTVPDAALTWKNRNAWSGYFMSDVLDPWSPRAQRERLLKNLQEGDENALKWYFRLSAFSVFLQQSNA